jgi:hypothetical protein
MPEEDLPQLRDKARARWLTTLFYLMGVRISEVAAGTMGNFGRELGTDGTQRWWLEVIGKGLKYRRIPVSNELLGELMRYRQAHGLEPLPTRNEVTPLLLPFRRRAGNAAGEGVNRKSVHNAIKAVFEKAADWTEARGGEYVEHAAHIREASAHWLRHYVPFLTMSGNVDRLPRSPWYCGLRSDVPGQSPDIFPALQAIQEVEKLVCRPVASLLAAGRRCLRKSFLLHRECRFDIDLRGFHGFMSEPQRNHRTTNARLQKVHGHRVSQTVNGDPFLL